MRKYFLFGDIEYQMYFSSIYRSFPTSLVKKNGNWKEREKEIKINNKKPSFSFICFSQDHPIKSQKNVAT